MKHLIVQGGMGVGISLSNLAGTVASYGGVGVIAAAQIGFNFDGFENNPLKANLEALAHHIKRAKEISKGGVIGVNIMHALANYKEYVKCAIENKADYIISGAGLPIDLPSLAANSAVKIAPIISSVKAAKVLLSFWAKKYNRTADMVIVEGPKAGGHLCFTNPEQETNYDTELKNILKEISAFAERFGKIPTIFAGGVHDKADVEKYINIGCDGVQLGTRFVATFECDAHENFKQNFINAKKEDVTIVKSPVGMPGRAINNAFIKSPASKGEVPITKCYRCIKNCNPKEIPYCISQALINSAKGQTNTGLVFCGDNVDRVKEITGVKQVLDELV